ncbi:2-oxo-4-hydroxy-4-carboxy-5-ureidoimidazoline decarboxylase [Streptomyces sp. NPDC012888]|uniref:2-oxo-4-hydroxy-4-carboxy-5-ureidoimidazoline decarboxylase n=1 Tax=Streptomyces sp. NPDC012888 TaxID=3364855 RepID=UPI0036A15EE0
MARFNAASAEEAEAALLRCCASRRWAHRVAAHRPYPDAAALLAAADEAAYDLSPADLTEALRAEPSARLRADAPYAAQLALGAAHAEYERLFGHAFVICLDGHDPRDHIDVVLSGIQARLAHAVDDERAVAADELRRLARARLLSLAEASADLTDPAGDLTDPDGHLRPVSPCSPLWDSPSVPV